MLFEITFITAAKAYAKRNTDQANQHRTDAAKFVERGEFKHAIARIELAEMHEHISALYSRIAVKLAEVIDLS